MIPVLYEKTENDFTTYGIGALSDVVSCIVSEERNGQYELIMTYPISGKQYDEIQAERIIKAKAKPLGDNQLFRIYRMSKPIHGMVTIYAQHISYDLSGTAITPFSASKTPQEAMEYVLNNTGFTAHTDKSGSKTFGTAIPKSARALLGGTEGSVLDQWGGEFKWDNFDVYLYTNRGLDKDVVIEYGKNLTDLLADHDLSEVYSELLPYATYSDDSGSHTVTGDPIAITSVISRTKTLIKDFTYAFDGAMTKAQVEAKAASWLTDNPLGYETPSLTVSFINLPAPQNYPAAAATIDLCDTVTIRYTALGVDVKAKVVSCEYDTLLERYTKLTIGKPRANMADTVANLTDQSKVVADYPALWKSAIEVATQMITGNAGGNVVLHEGPDGKPFELLIMDDPDITQATKIWRWTLGGLGFSSNGYAGPYDTAITANGMINADFIQTGELDADLITTGKLLIKDSSNNVLFDADADNKTVNIGGFTVSAAKFSNTSGSVTVEIGANGSFKITKNYNETYLEPDVVGITATGGRFIELQNDGTWGTQLMAYSPNGATYVRPGTVEVDDSTEENILTLYPTGIKFDDTQGHSTVLWAKAYGQASAGTITIDLAAGVYLAMTTRGGSTDSNQTGYAVIQANSSGSSVREIVTASNSTLSISGLVLTWTTTNTSRALRLIRLS